ncbi:MAG: PQQ-binding-like beta-propeller repeat protein [Methyloceanibacter sp.]|jgi:outer membrane protein assembly factor BamB|nr:PQQ-binding-like beta-propeller repeat protein [Methyloceanibacter sp.]
MVLAGCGGTSLDSLQRTIKNPFAKKEVPLPGERIAVITDPTLVNVDPAEAGRPVQLPPPQANASWSQPGGSPSNNLGHLALSGEVRKVWSADAGTGSSSSGRLSAVPLVADGKVFTLDAGGTVSAFSSASGGRLWAADVTPDNEKRKEGFGGGLAMDGGRLYAATGFGTVVAIDPGNGAVVWSKRIGEPIRSAPTAAGGKIYFVSAGNILYALNDQDGQQLWTSRGLPQAATLLSNVSPAVSGGLVVAPFPSGDVAAFESGSGKATWRESLARSSETSAAAVLGDPARPVIDRGVVFVVSHGGKMIAMSESSGERLWTRNIAGTQMPWIAGDTVYVVDLAGKLIALARADGKVRWVADLPSGARWSGPVLAGGKLWLVSGEGLLVGADARTGQLATQVDLGTPVFVAPVVAGGRMYILADNASLIALN